MAAPLLAAIPALLGKAGAVAAKGAAVAAKGAAALPLKHLRSCCICC